MSATSSSETQCALRHDTIVNLPCVRMILLLSTDLSLCTNLALLFNRMIEIARSTVNTLFYSSGNLYCKAKLSTPMIMFGIGSVQMYVTSIQMLTHTMFIAVLCYYR